MSKNTQPKPLLTIDELADYLKVHRATVRAWASAEAIPHLRIVVGAGLRQRATLRFDLGKVLEWLGSMEVAPGPAALRGRGQ